MAELASGAVSSLLGVIRNEAALLGGVRGDVQFIKEEMESMNSFLEHLARTVPPSGEHDPQVRTWMGQVRLLAQDCNNCIDLYLYRGNPEIHLPKGGPLRYLWWAPWFLQKLVAQHRAAVQLRELKDRARDVGERRLRYGVEVPEKAAAAERQSKLAGDGAGDDELQFDRQLVVAPPADYSGLRAFFEPPTLDDYFEAKLVAWISGLADTRTRGQDQTRGSSVAVVVAPNRPAAGEEEEDKDNNNDDDDDDDNDDDDDDDDNEDDDDNDSDDNGGGGGGGGGGGPNFMDEASAVAEKHSGDSVVVVSVDIPTVHWDWGSPPRPKEILYYILRALALKIKPGVTDKDAEQFISDLKIHPGAHKWGIYREKKDVFDEIKDKIEEMDVDEKFHEVLIQIKEAKGEQLRLDLKQRKNINQEISGRDLFVLIMWLVNPATGDEQVTKKAMPTLERWSDSIIKEAAKKLKHLIKGRGKTSKQSIHLHKSQYESILKEVFHKTSSSESQQATNTSTAAVMVEDQIKEMIHKVTEMLQDLQEDINSGKQQQAGRPADGEDQLSDDIVREATEKINIIRWKVRERLKIQWMVDRIKYLLNHKKALIILNTDDDTMDASRWEETRSSALSLLDSTIVGTLIFTTTASTQKAKQYCHPQHQEPIQYSLVGLYHDTVLNFTRQYRNYSPQILHNILDQCEPHEFCMKIFAHALYANPKRSSEELLNLHSTLQAVSPRSFVSIAKKMFKFSYNDLPKEYKSCLLYLAIFRPGQKIRRSTLIGRWVVEGLITTEDWRWSSSVNRARHCFDALIDQWLVYPADIGATGEVKSCMVGDLVHGFITRIAEKQRIMETRLSHHLACHFSITNNLRLRGSDKIDDFLRNLSQPSQFSLLKVLDLEGCHCFGANSKRYFKNICYKIKLLKYLSLRGTNITQLHSEINSLHELEVLDIRQTEVSPSATRNVRLLKLKRLLAGDPASPGTTNTRIAIDDKRITTTSVEIPEKVENMEGMEVLSNVKPRSPQDLKDIGRLWQLRKLGVVIEDRRKHLKGLLQAIWNLCDCLRSLSITIVPKAGHSSSKGSQDTSIDFSSPKKRALKVLESLSISGNTKKDLESRSTSGNTEKVQLLELLLDRKDKENNPLTKVSLSNTDLSQEDLEVLANLPKLLCLRLRHKAYNHSKLTFKEGQFQHLKYFLVEGSNMTDIIFDEKAARELEKIVLPLCDGLNLFGVDKLPKLKELELNNNNKSNNGSSSKNNSNDNNGRGKNNITVVIATNTSTATPTIDTKAVDTIATTTTSSATATPTSDVTIAMAPTACNLVATAAITSGGDAAAPTSDATTITAPTTSILVATPIHNNTATASATTANINTKVITSVTTSANTSTITNTVVATPITDNYAAATITATTGSAAATPTTDATTIMPPTTSNLIITPSISIGDANATPSTDTATETLGATPTTNNDVTASATTSKKINTSSTTPAITAAVNTNANTNIATATNNIDATAAGTSTIETTSTHGTTANVITAHTTAAATTTTTTDTATPTSESNASTASTNIDPTASTTHITEIANTSIATNDVTVAPTTNTNAAAPTTTDTADVVSVNSNTTVKKTNTFLSFVENAKGLTKVTLRGTMLKEDDMKILAKKPTICCLVLLDKSYDNSKLTFNTDEFPKLNLLIVERDIMEISFAAGSCPKLKRLVWTFTKIITLSGIDNLPRLNEVEFKGDFIPNEVKQTINKLKNRLHFTHYESENQDRAEGNLLEEENAAKSLRFWKNKGWCWRK